MHGGIAGWKEIANRRDFCTNGVPGLTWSRSFKIRNTTSYLEVGELIGQGGVSVVHPDVFSSPNPDSSNVSL